MICSVLSHEIGHLVGGHFINEKNDKKCNDEHFIVYPGSWAIAGGAPARLNTFNGWSTFASARTLAFSNLKALGRSNCY